MSELREFLKNQDIGVTSTGDGLHIAVSFFETVHTFVDAFEWVHPVWVGAGEALTTSGIVTVGGVAFAVAGPVLGMAGVFMALGSGYEEAREEIQNEAVASGFSQGFVAGILNMSPKTVSFIFGRHGVIHRNPMDEEADALEMKAYNRGLVAGYTLASTATDEQKKSFVYEIREYTGHVDAGAWGDREKRDYVIEYAAKLRLHFLNEME